MPSKVDISEFAAAVYALRSDNQLRLSSNISEHIQHPAYRAIVRLGWSAVPFLIGSFIEEGFDLWSPALCEITGENPHEGTYESEKIREAWIAWAKEKGVKSFFVDPELYAPGPRYVAYIESALDAYESAMDRLNAVSDSATPEEFVKEFKRVYLTLENGVE